MIAVSYTNRQAHILAIQYGYKYGYIQQFQRTNISYFFNNKNDVFDEIMNHDVMHHDNSSHYLDGLAGTMVYTY